MKDKKYLVMFKDKARDELEFFWNGGEMFTEAEAKKHLIFLERLNHGDKKIMKNFKIVEIRGLKK